MGISEKDFIAQFPEFKMDEYFDEKDETVGQYYYAIPDKEINLTIGFSHNKLIRIYIEDSWAEGYFNQFDPIAIGFTKTGEGKEFINDMYPDKLTEIFQKDNIKISVSYGRFGFLKIEDLNYIKD